MQKRWGPQSGGVSRGEAIAIAQTYAQPGMTEVQVRALVANLLAASRIGQGSTNYTGTDLSAAASVSTVALSSSTGADTTIPAATNAAAGVATAAQIATLEQVAAQVTTAAFKVAGVQVLAARRTGWAAQTGTATRSAYATYTAPVISAAYTQSEVQALANAVQAIDRRLKALTDDLIAHGAIGA